MTLMSDGKAKKFNDASGIDGSPDDKNLTTKFDEAHNPAKAILEIIAKGMNSANVEQLQTHLKALDIYDGKIDSKWGKKTADALNAFIEQHKDDVAFDKINKSYVSGLLDHGHDVVPDHLKPVLSRQELVNIPGPKIKYGTRKGGALERNHTTSKGANADRPALYHPHVRMIMEIKDKNDPRIKALEFEIREIYKARNSKAAFDIIQEKQKWIKLTKETAIKHDLNPVLYVNQLYRESKFNPKQGSSAGAMGISQMVPRWHKGKYGLKTLKDFSNPEKSIEAGALYLKELMSKIDPDSKLSRDERQKFALVAYNGGPSAPHYGDSFDGKKDQAPKNVHEWMEFVEGVIAKQGKGSIGAWRNQTYNYIRKIVPDYWEGDKLQQAISYDVLPPDGLGVPRYDGADTAPPRTFQTQPLMQ